jgi:capsid protein
MSHVVNSVVAAALAVASLATPTALVAADYVTKGGNDVGECAKSQYLSQITSRFRHQVNNVPELPNVSIVDFQNIHEHRYLPETEEWPIPRRYCGATAILSDGNHREVWYLIEGHMGFVGIGENVEFCVAGFDRWYVYNGACRVLR